MILSFNHISKLYPPNIVAIKDVSFQIDEGEFALIVGKTGAGKTTLIKMILGEEWPTKGEIFCLGYSFSKIRKREILNLRRQIGVAFQDYRLFPQKTVYENVAYSLEAINVPSKIISRDVPQVLELLGLKDRVNNFSYQLSEGEKQKLSLARALVRRPKIILADEPTGNLDYFSEREIMALLKKINERGTTIILATHNKDIVGSKKSRVIILEKGKIIGDSKAKNFN